ncbi:MogA/MoaB family molybdenum cofactor biosynthesis protein [Petroclostridium sp. X23]|uniref:MogA/MoaB family molybdenum cofactor biosynthesis protein n=1 Tax=Petroclostridium sp. X23 TaxID=3045146 RepID=UPI0024AE5372|nr:MogA/MoaB family molybdenum cofactor biosynthesis protein [Petroclostridium sp. X23]WHH61783.1 MogA/MoaB family molybdenum cofactor biosynthesis protein [Petroclostridium sp. X23]
MIKAGIITASDKGYAGERIDESGKVIAERMGEINAEVVRYIVSPDERDVLSSHLKHMADELSIDLIFTTGGTGFSPRDITPEATLDVIDRHVPGIPEAMRAKSLEITSRAMLSRAVSGIRNKTLIINLPGSPKGVSECLDIILPVLPHAIQILKGQTGECARK